MRVRKWNLLLGPTPLQCRDPGIFGAKGGPSCPRDR